MEYGIPENAIPITSDGKLVRDGHLGWLANQKRLEQQRKAAAASASSASTTANRNAASSEQKDEDYRDRKPSSSSTPPDGEAEGTTTSTSTDSSGRANPDAIISSPAAAPQQTMQQQIDSIPPASIPQPAWNVGGVADSSDATAATNTASNPNQIQNALEAILRGALQTPAGPAPGPMDLQTGGMTNQLLASSAASLLSQLQAAQFLQYSQQQQQTQQQPTTQSGSPHTSMETGSGNGGNTVPAPAVPTEVGPTLQQPHQSPIAPQATAGTQQVGGATPQSQQQSPQPTIPMNQGAALQAALGLQQANQSQQAPQPTPPMDQGAAALQAALGLQQATQSQDTAGSQQGLTSLQQAVRNLQQPTPTIQFGSNPQQTTQQGTTSQVHSNFQTTQSVQQQPVQFQLGTNEGNQMFQQQQQQQTTNQQQFGNMFLPFNQNSVAVQTPAAASGPPVNAASNIMPNLQNMPVSNPAIASQILSVVQSAQNMSQQPNNAQQQLVNILSNQPAQQAGGDQGQGGQQPMQDAFIQFVPDFQNTSNPAAAQGNNNAPIQGTVAIPGLVPGTFFVGNVVFDPQALLQFGLSASNAAPAAAAPAPQAAPSAALPMPPMMQPSPAMFRPIMNAQMPMQNLAQLPPPMVEAVPLPHPPLNLPAVLYQDYDANWLSDYQCFLRKQIEAFEASGDDVQYNASRMNRSIVLGQVGLRCIHCKAQPEWDRASGAVYYPGKLSMLYQAGQNMAKNHLCHGCKLIPQETRDLLNTLRGANRRATTGKDYWSKTARALGICEDGSNGLKFQRPQG